MRKRTHAARKGEHLKQMELLHTIGLEIISVFDLDKLLMTVARDTKGILGYDNCAIFLVEGNELVLKTAYHFPRKLQGKKLALGEGIVGRSAQMNRIINVPDISQCSYYLSSGLKGIRSEIAVPIVCRSNLIGILTIESTRKNAFSRNDERVLSILSSEIGIAIRNAKLAQSKDREMTLLHKAGIKIVSIMDLNKLLSTILNLIRKSLSYDNCALFLPSDGTLVLKAQSHFPKRILGLEIEIGKGIVGRCASKKKTIIINDVPRCDYYISSKLEGVQSALAIPILFENRLMAVLATESLKKNAFGEEDIRLLSILASQIGVALRNAEMHEELKKKVVTDSLTGLYNHRYFISRLEKETLRARRYGRDLSLILIDLDNFKMVNDLFGHMKGDEVLIATARILLKNIRRTDRSAIMKDVEIDIPVRYGGEEFMIILPETSLRGAMIAAERLRELIREEVNRSVPLIHKNGKRLIVTGSLGVSLLRASEKSEDLIRRVDQAMYEAKKRGKDRIVCID